MGWAVREDPAHNIQNERTDDDDEEGQGRTHRRVPAGRAADAAGTAEWLQNGGRLTREGEEEKEEGWGLPSLA